MKVLGIVGSMSARSKTRTATKIALNAVGDQGAETAVLHLREYDPVTADGRHLDAYDGPTKDALDHVIASDAYLIGTPVYRAAYSGLLKNFFDLIPRGRWQADVAPFENAAVGLVATGASDHHYLAIDEELRPVLSFFGAHTVGGSVYATDAHFEDDDLVDHAVRKRLETLGRATVDLARAIEQSDALSTLGPQI